MKKIIHKTIPGTLNSLLMQAKAHCFSLQNVRELSFPLQTAFSAFVGIFFILFCGMLHANTVAVVRISGLEHLYDGRPKQATVITEPSGLMVNVLYSEASNYPASESSTLRVNAGTYIVRATVIQPGFTGESIRTFYIRKINQSPLNVARISAKKLGDAPFQVMASPVELPITRWLSSDPSVATISSVGMVTIVGAGFTSLIAVQDGNENYNARRDATPLDVALSGVPLPQQKRDLVFSGDAHQVNLADLPSGQASFFSYRDTKQALPVSTPQVIFQNGPDILDLSYQSTGFSATSTWGLGKYVQFAGTARQLHSCDVTLVNWARFESDQMASWLAANPQLFVPPKPGISIPGDSGGFYHPITLSFYEYGVSGTNESFRLLMSKTINGFIPWRPMRLEDGSIYPNNGYAFRVPFEFPEGFILPEALIIGVSFNTENSGIKPIRISGPYNLLNVPSIPASYTPKIGTSVADPYTFDFENWMWTGYSGNLGPMLRVRATAAAASLTPPVNAGTYEVKTFSVAFPDLLNVTSMWVIDKAPVQVDLMNTRYLFDGNAKGVSVSTLPAGIATVTTYSGSSTAPRNVGRYDVVVEANHPNYRGVARDFMTISDTFSTWKDVAFAGSGLTELQKTDAADPDGDGVNNLMAYAANFNPTGGNTSAASKIEQEDETLTFTYRSNALAGDVIYAVEVSDNLTDPQSWKAVVPKKVSVISDDGKTRVNEVKIDKPKDEKQLFVRLKVERAADPRGR